MKIIDTLDQFDKIKAGCVLTIGNFDGVHTGHQAILLEARQIARQRGAELTVMTFEPHPVAILHPEKAPKALTPLDQKLHLLAPFADDCVIVLKDNLQLLDLSAEQFIDRFLAQTLRPSALVEGEDFNFGSGRKGNIRTLANLGRKHGFTVRVVPTHHIRLPDTGQEIRVSSTIIRYMLEGGHVADAAAALGRPFRLQGQVIAGRGKGRQIGFPTLNMARPDQVLPAEGVYAGRVALASNAEQLALQGQAMPAVFSIGQARTFGEESPLLIEAHVLDRRVEDTPGLWMAMDFIQLLRTQHKFPTVTDLVRQIAKDCDRAARLAQSWPSA